MSNQEIRIRQICLVAHDLDRVQRQPESVFGVELCWRDPAIRKIRLNHTLIPFGNQILECVSPLPGEYNTPAERYLHRRGGDGGYMVIMQTPQSTYAAYRERAEGLGIPIISEPGEEPKSNGIQLHPRTFGAIPELRWNVEEAQEGGAWWPAGDDWQRKKFIDVVDGIRAAELQTNGDPAELAARWGEILDEPVGTDANGNPSIAMRGSDLRFVAAHAGRGAAAQFLNP